MRFQRTALIAAGALVAALWMMQPAAGQKEDRAEVLLRAAIKKELVDGDLKAAIEQYKQIVVSQSGNRPVAAKALLQMGQCYEKMGHAEARKAYDRLLREYADQRDVAAEARARLAALSQPADASRASGMVVRRVWAGSVHNLMGAVSPDGRYFSYRDLPTRGLGVRDLVTGETHLADGPRPGQVGWSTFSPDSRQVVYAWSHGIERFYDLRILRLEARPGGAVKGSEPRVLYSPRGKEVNYIRPHEWSADGKYILARFGRTDGSNQIVLVSVADGSVRALKTLDWRYPVKMSLSPDGRYIAYDFPPKEDSPARDIFLLATDGSREIALVEHPADDRLLGWAPDDERILFSSDRSGTIDARVIQVTEGRPQGAPTLVKRDLGQVRPMGFTRKGSFYYGLRTEGFDLYTATLDPETGKVVVPPSQATESSSNVRKFMPAWSPDGQYLAYGSLGDPLPTGRIVIRSLKTGEERELSPKLNAIGEYSLRWSPDGKYFLVAGLDGKDRPGLFQVDAKTGDTTPIVYGNPKGTVIGSGSWSPDGKAIFYTRNDLDPNPLIGRIVLRDLQSGQEKEIYRAVPPPARVGSLRLSPDGRWLAFNLLEGPRATMVRPMIMPAGGGAVRELPTPQPREARGLGLADWTPDSRHVLFVRFSRGLRSAEVPSDLWRIPAEGGEPQKMDLAVKGMHYDLAVHPDGRRIAFALFSASAEDKDEVWAMENFLPALRAAR